MEEAKSDFSASLIHIGTSEWEKDIGIPGLKIPPELRKIPKDGHYAVGYNRLIANKLADTLEKNFVLSRIKLNKIINQPTTLSVSKSFHSLT